MSKIRRNILANFLGRGWTVISAVVFLPFYVQFLGVEAYGLVGVFAALQTILAVGDMGLSATLTREMARLSSHPETGAEAGDTIRTTEVWYLAVGAAIAGAAALAAPFIANHWLRAGSIPTASIAAAIRWMGLAFSFQAASSFYQGGLLGLQRQVQSNAICVSMGLARAAGTLVVLSSFSATIGAYAATQALFALAQLLWMRWALWKCVPPSRERPRYRHRILRGLWRYSAGMMGMTITATILLETDKVILSRMLPLEVFGYYTLAWTFAQIPISALSSPVFQAVFPQLTQHVARGDTAALSSLYHVVSQVLATLVLPFAAFAGLFSRECLYLWLGNPGVAVHSAPLVEILVIATGLTGVLVMPYALVLAHGWAGLSLKTNIAVILFLIPSLIVLTRRFGAIGACASQVLLSTISITIWVSIVHLYALPGEQARWYLRDLLPPFAASLAPLLLFRLVFPPDLSRPALLAALFSVWLSAALAAAAAAPDIRRPAVRMACTGWRALRSRCGIFPLRPS